MIKSISLILVLMGCVYAQDTLNTKLSAPVHQNISRTCFGCICEAATGCKIGGGCTGDVCGPFAITWAYWADSGKPTLNNEPNTNEGAWARCVNDPFCASFALQGYMDKFAQDCNKDGVINCDDYLRIHSLGGYGCGGALNPKYENSYRACMKSFAQSNH